MLTFPKQNGPVHCVRFSPTEPMLASAAGKGATISLWSLQTQKRSLLRGAPKSVGEFQFSPDGQRLCAVTESAQVICWDVATRSVQMIFPQSQQYEVIRYPVRPYPASFPCQIGWEASGDAVVVSNFHPPRNQPRSDSGTVHPGPCVRRFRLSTESEESLMDQPVSSLVGLNVLPDGKLLFRSLARTLIVYDPDRREEVKQFWTEEENLDVRMSPTQEWVAGHFQDHITYWHWDDDHTPRKIMANHREVLRLEFAASGDQILTGGADGTVKLWDCASGDLVSTWDWGLGRITALACSADGQLFAAGGQDGIIVWDAE